MIDAQRLSKSFAEGPFVLNDVSLQIQPGEIVSLVGPSGCGKSTLLRLIAGLETATAGQVDVEDKAEIGFVFQDATLLPWRTVTQNIALPFELGRRSSKPSGSPTEQQEAIHKSLELIGLSKADADKYPAMLSGGMKMRVSLARALVTDPPILLLDEPFAALDDMLRQQLNEDLLNIWADRRFTAVFVTHNVAEAVYLSHRVLIMSSNPGRVVHDIAVPFDYPRPWQLRTEARFGEIVADVSSRLRKVAA